MANIFKSKYTGEQIEEILDKANNVTDVQANNGEPTTADLSTLKIGDVNYKIPEPPTPETPTEVEANPSGDATAELSKLKVGETIYSIPQNSGGGSSGGEFVKFRFSLHSGGGAIKGGFVDMLIPFIDNASPNTIGDYIAKIGVFSVRDTDHGSQNTIGHYMVGSNASGKCTYTYISSYGIGTLTPVRSCKINGVDVTSTRYTETTAHAGDFVNIELYYDSGND